MPLNIQKTVLVDGPRHAVVHLVLTCDRSSPDLVNAPLIDTKNDIYPIGQATQSTITQLWWGHNAFDAVLSRNDTVPVPIWLLAAGVDSHVDFRAFGGIKVPIDMDGNGDILISTIGFTTAGQIGTYIVELRKD